MSLLVKSLEDAGYIDGKSLLGAPYDFRYGPGTKPSSVGRKYLYDLQKLVEEAYTSNGDKQVVLVSHSLGGLWVLYLLNQQPLSWRQQYIKHFVAIAAPWGGTVQEMRTFASGYSLDIPTVNPLVVRAEQRSSESNLWLLPVPEVFGNKTLVTTEEKTYSALDMPEFLKDIGFSEGIYPYKSRIRPLTEHLKAPQVPVTLIFGTGIDTPETLIYGKGGFDQQPEIIMGDGDGTVNSRSLSAVVSDWSATEGQKLVVVKIPQCTHTTILKDDDSIQKIVDVILGASLQSAHSAVDRCGLYEEASNYIKKLQEEVFHLRQRRDCLRANECHEKTTEKNRELEVDVDVHGREVVISITGMTRPKCFGRMIEEIEQHGVDVNMSQLSTSDFFVFLYFRATLKESVKEYNPAMLQCSLERRLSMAY